MDWLEKSQAAGVEGFLHPLEMQRLYDLAQDREVLEIGAFKGLSAWIMAQSAKAVLSVDTFQACDNGQDQLDNLTTLDAFLSATKDFHNVSHFIGTSEEAGEKLVGDWDMIFIDANHTYEDTKADILRWWPRVRAGGVMAFHDYGHADFPGVKQAADEVFGDLGEYEPGTQAWVVTLRWEVKK